MDFSFVRRQFSSEVAFLASLQQFVNRVEPALHRLEKAIRKKDCQTILEIAREINLMVRLVGEQSMADYTAQLMHIGERYGPPDILVFELLKMDYLDLKQQISNTFPSIDLPS